MSTRLPAATARCMSPSTSTYESRVMTKGMSVVTPPVTACRLSVAQSAAKDWAALPRCRCVSMSPGMTKRPPASMVRRAGSASPGRSTAAMAPPRTARAQSTTASGFTTRQFATRRSASIGSPRLLQDVAVGVGPAELEEPPEVAHVLAYLGIDVGVEDLAVLVSRAGHHPALRVDEQRAAEVVTVGGTPDILADLVDAAHVEHVGDGVAAQLDLPHVANPLAIGRRRHEEEVRPLHAEHARGFGEMPVVADEDPDLEAERGLEHGEAEVPGLEEEPLVARGLPRLHSAEDLGNRHLPVLADEPAVGADDRGGVVEQAPVVLVERVHDHRARLSGDLSQPIDGGAGHGLGRLEPLDVAVEAEIDRRAQLREAHDLG